MTDTAQNAVPVCWVVTEGLAGLQSQALGLVEALGLPYTLKTLKKPGLPWRVMPAAVWPLRAALALGLDNMGRPSPLTAPWPDVLITCGRCSVAASMAIRHLSKGVTFTIHIQDPHVAATHFDRIIVAQHDGLRAPNVLATAGALHRVTQKKLVAAAVQFGATFNPMPKPLIAVLVGGGLKGARVDAAAMREFAEKLKALALSSGGSLAVTPSRRTGTDNIAILKSVLAGVPAYIWDGQPENPYFGLLALADAIVVTSDSVSMTSEACFTGKPVYMHDFGIRSKRLRRFQQGLLSSGVTRPLSGVAAQWSYPRVDSVAQAVDFIRPALQEHLATRFLPVPHTGGLRQ